MSTPQTKETLIRLAWTTALRLQGDRQCYDTYRDGWGRVCALGLLLEVAGIDPDIEEPQDVGELAGLHARYSRQVVAMNDGDSLAGSRKFTFAEIADRVDSWFAPAMSAAARAEFARDHDLPEPDDWPEEWHRLYEDDGGLELLAIANSCEVGIVRRAIERQRELDAYARRWPGAPMPYYRPPSEKDIEARRLFVSKFIGEVGEVED
jgi:hypothetical protein